MAGVKVIFAVMIVAITVAIGASFVTKQKSPKPVSDRRDPKVLETDDGRVLLWAQGPRDVNKGEWFDVTASPLEPHGYQYGIGKDTIPAIDTPTFVSIQDVDELAKFGIDDDTTVIGYASEGEAKAYPIGILDAHELVNDVVAGQHVTVAW